MPRSHAHGTHYLPPRQGAAAGHPVPVPVLVMVAVVVAMIVMVVVVAAIVTVPVVAPVFWRKLLEELLQ